MSAQGLQGVLHATQPLLRDLPLHLLSWQGPLCLLLSHWQAWNCSLVSWQAVCSPVALADRASSLRDPRRSPSLQPSCITFRRSCCLWLPECCSPAGAADTYRQHTTRGQAAEDQAEEGAHTGNCDCTLTVLGCHRSHPYTVENLTSKCCAVVYSYCSTNWPIPHPQGLPIRRHSNAEIRPVNNLQLLSVLVTGRVNQ